MDRQTDIPNYRSSLLELKIRVFFQPCLIPSAFFKNGLPFPFPVPFFLDFIFNFSLPFPTFSGQADAFWGSGSIKFGFSIQPDRHYICMIGLDMGESYDTRFFDAMLLCNPIFQSCHYILFFLRKSCILSLTRTFVNKVIIICYINLFCWQLREKRKNCEEKTTTDNNLVSLNYN